jgi:hypothetical protein
MFFHIEQSHDPADCPYGSGGSRTLHNAQAPSVRVVGIYGAYSEHVVFMVVEADDLDAVHAFLAPGMRTCTAAITPVSDHPMPVA